ncbi:purple acid phosphatase family protein [Nocardioides hwasunensis]|uniref:Metallophosphoesterase family protein n=1 Tax=Nocardioides hwasunensis TaxID=397258 RepID=A0ABR8MA61_9ACTN|nr:metallophosphoesterase family protein [Nocardioides hwasunensis]MBD3913047.1 metallophosphoesterase family protein [Nocardioides hwasunensis]
MKQPLAPSGRPRRRLTAILASTGLVSTLLASTALTSSTPATAAPSTDPLISTAGTTWRYLDDNTEPHRGAAEVLSWTGSAYDATDWKSATGSFGAIRGQLGSVSGYTPSTLLNQYVDGSSAPNVPTFFFRTTFDVDAATITGIRGLAAEVVFDDALRVYVNGERVFNDVDERATDTTKNLQYAGNGGGAPVTRTFTVSPDALRPGTNTVAVALYQDRETSSDIYFDFKELVPVLTEPVAAPPSRVILTPTEDPTRSQSFSWQAGNEGETVARVQLQPTAGGLTRTLRGYPQGMVNSNPLEHFSATVAGLEPGTEYRYRVGNPTAYSPWYTFTTADPSVTDFSYLYYGDAQIGLDSTWPKVVEQSLATAPDAIGSVHAGDLIDTASNETQWVNWFEGMETAAATKNIMAAPGNHEYSGDRYLKAWKANFEYPLNQPTTETIGDLVDLAKGEGDVAAQYRAYFDHWSEFAAETVYFTDYQGVRFITVNATRDTGFLTPEKLPTCQGTTCPSTKVAELWTEFQAAWLDHVLTTTKSKWNVVTFHQPVYSTSSGRNEPVLRKHWVPVFQKHNIDLVQMGHDHTYARGYNNEDRTAEPGITDGPVYIVSNSGAKHYDLETDARNVWTLNGATQVLRGAGVTTYQVIEVSQDQLVYTSYLAEKTADATTDLPVGAVYDRFTVTKTDDGRKWVTEAGVEAPVPPAPPTVEPTEQPVVVPPGTVPPVTVPPVVVAPPVLPAMVQTDVRPRVSRTRVGKAPVLRVRATASGTVRITATRGKVRIVRTVAVTDDSVRKVRLPRTLTKRTGRLVVRLTLTPAASTDLPSRSTLHTVVRR